MSDFDPVDPTCTPAPAAPKSVAPTARQAQPPVSTPPTDRDAARADLKDRSARQRSAPQAEPQHSPSQNLPGAPSVEPHSEGEFPIDFAPAAPLGSPQVGRDQRDFRQRGIEFGQRMQRKLLARAEVSSLPIKRWAALSAATIVAALTDFATPKAVVTAQPSSVHRRQTLTSQSLAPAASPQTELASEQNTLQEAPSNAVKRRDSKKDSAEELLVAGGHALGKARIAQKNERKTSEALLVKAREIEARALAEELERIDMQNSRENPEIGQIKASATGPYASSKFLLIAKVNALNQEEDRLEEQAKRKKKLG